MPTTFLRIPSKWVLFLGAGSAAIGLADLFVSALGQQGIAPGAARQQVRMFDTKGLVVDSNLACVERPADYEAFIRSHAYKPQYANLI